MFLLIAALLLQSQPQTVLVRVTDAASGLVLPNAEVIDLRSNSRRFTNAQGEARIPWPESGALTLRVRQLGFQFIERTVPRGDAAAEFALQRVAYVLPVVQTTVASVCDVQTDSTAALLSASVLAQLRQGAERYEQFRRAYPFRVSLERRTGEISRDGDVKPTRASLETEHSDRWGEPYRPNRVVERDRFGFSVPILFLSSLADSVFWERHCFIAVGVESLDSARVVRLAFVPKPSVTTPDWEGAALVDSASSILRRIEFRLTGLRPGDRPRRFEGYTTFMSPAPYFVVPDTTRAIWWRRDVSAERPWGMPDVIQHINVQSIAFVAATPADYRQPKP